MPGCTELTSPFRRGAAALVLLLAGGIGPLAAQVPGLPVFAGGVLRGLELGGAVGLSPDGGPVGKARVLAAGLALGSRRVGLRSAAGVLDPEGNASARAVAGGLVSVRLISGGVQSPLSIDVLGGYGAYDGPETVSRQAVAGASFILAIPTPVVSVRPWLAPRVDWRSVSPTDGSELTSALGGSAGIDLRFLGGLALRAAWDKIEGRSRVIGFGAGYTF